MQKSKVLLFPKSNDAGREKYLQETLEDFFQLSEYINRSCRITGGDGHELSYFLLKLIKLADIDYAYGLVCKREVEQCRRG